MTDTADENKAAPAAQKHRIDWWAEIRGVFWLLLAVLGFHSFVAKPFYIPSESMMPGLLVGDRLVVTKYPYGWSFVSPTFHLLPFMKGRIWGKMPERGDVVIAAPPGVKEDYIKRVIGLPGDRIEVRNGTVILNGVPVKRDPVRFALIPVDENAPCSETEYPGLKMRARDGNEYCRMPIVRETLPNGRSYNTIDLGYRYESDDYPAITIPDNHVFLMGDNRDRSADSRYPAVEGAGIGIVPTENIVGRAWFSVFSTDGSAEWLKPWTWFSAARWERIGEGF